MCKRGITQRCKDAIASTSMKVTVYCAALALYVAGICSTLGYNTISIMKVLVLKNEHISKSKKSKIHLKTPQKAFIHSVLT